jgi:hypothetical protein
MSWQAVKRGVTAVTYVMTSSHVSHAEKANVDLTVLPVYKNYKM